MTALQIGVIDYVKVENTIFGGDIQKAFLIKPVLLNTKKVIFNANIEGKTPNIEVVKRNIQLMFNYERLEYRLRGRETVQEKMGLLIGHFEDHSS